MLFRSLPGKGFTDVFEAAMRAKAKKPLKPKLSVPTRWNSDYLMVARCIKLHEFYKVALAAKQ